MTAFKKNFISVVLMLAMLASGLPVYSPLDPNRDEKVDLKDAVLLVKAFTSEVTENPSEFKEQLEQVVTGLSVVAGLKSTIKPAKDTNSLSDPASGMTVGLISAVYSVNPSCNWSYVPDRPQNIQSINPIPATPPPRVLQCA